MLYKTEVKNRKVQIWTCDDYYWYSLSAQKWTSCQLCKREYAQNIHRFTVGVHNNCTKPLSATIVNWPIKLFSDELMSCTADWSDTTNTLVV